MRYDETNYIYVKNLLKKLSDDLDNAERMKTAEDAAAFCCSLRELVLTINRSFFDVDCICGYEDLTAGPGDISAGKSRELTEKYREYAKYVQALCNERQSQPTSVDRNFCKIMQQAGNVSAEKLTELVTGRFLKKTEKELEDYREFFHHFRKFWGELDAGEGNFEAIRRRISVLKEHADDFAGLYQRLADSRSRAVLVNFLHNWLTMSEDDIFDMGERIFADYADFDILSCGAGEVIADVGAYTGDSALGYIYSFGDYQKMYCYELSPETAAVLASNLKDYPNIDIRCKGVGARHEWMKISTEGNYYSNGITNLTEGSDCSGSADYSESADHSEASGHSEKSASSQATEIVTLDEDINEKLTLIKMDIEGAERAAIQGSRRHITEEKPKLLISVYHGNEDIYEIPKLISSIRDDYQYYLRSSGWQYAPSEIVLYCI